MKLLWNWVKKIKTSYLLLLLPIAVIFNQWSTAVLNDWYRRSQFPVTYVQGQLSFSAAKLTMYYRHMLEQNSLPIYFQTQLIDFMFILSTMLLHGTLGLLFYKLLANRPFLKRLSSVGLITGLLAPCFDILENIVSFYFIANPEGIPQVLALVYSSFSACKFGLFVITYLLFGFLLLCGLWVAILYFRKRNIK
ncbi:hypothetical protein [Paenibacillus sp. SI8]|uniref:hypothetical protein n=1 Tax=unclassified Paenibacillus TaxID=185978 RepID=UPI003467155D